MLCLSGSSYVLVQPVKYPGGGATNVHMTHPNYSSGNPSILKLMQCLKIVGYVMQHCIYIGTTGKQHIHHQQMHVAANQGATHGYVIPPPPYHGHAAPSPQHVHAGHNYQGVGASSLQLQYTQAGKYAIIYNVMYIM